MTQVTGTGIKNVAGDIAATGTVTISTKPRMSGSGAYIDGRSKKESIVAGVLTPMEIEPGPVKIAVSIGSSYDTFDAVVPETGPVTLAELKEQTYTYEPPVVSQVQAYKTAAEAAATEAADILEQVGEAAVPDSLVAAHVESGTSETRTALNSIYAPVSVVDDVADKLDVTVAASTYASIRRVDLKNIPGVVGDGVTDNSAAIQAEIDALGSTSGLVEFFTPPGVWVTDGLKMKSNTIFTGVTAGTFGLDSFNATRCSVLKLKANATRPLFADYDPAIPTYGLVIRDLQLDGNKANQSTALPAIQLYDSASGMDPMWRIERTFIRNAKGDGIKIGTFRRAIKVLDSEVLDCDGNSIVLGATDCHIRGNVIGRSGASGIYATAGLQHISNCDVFHNVDGVKVDNVSGVMIIGCGIDLNKHNGVLTNGPRTLIIGSNFQSNGTETNNTYSHVNLGFPDQTALNTVVSGCAMRHDPTIPNKAKYGVSANVPFTLHGLAFNPAEVPWVSGMTENSGLAVLMSRTQGIQDGAGLVFGTTNGSMIGTAANQKFAFHGATPIVQPTLAPAATDLASAITLVNDIRAKNIALGLAN